jgi:hypothetical protein
MSPAQDRFLTEPLPLQLGAIAANLSRIRSFSDHPGHMKIVEGMIAETIGFVGFLLSRPQPSLPEELTELREWLAMRAGDWGVISADPEAVAIVAAEAGAWSDRVLQRSGLLNAG